MKVEGVLNEITGNSLKARSNGKSSIGLLLCANINIGRKNKIKKYCIGYILSGEFWLCIWISDVERYQNLSECVEWGRIRRKLNRK